MVVVDLAQRCASRHPEPDIIGLDHAPQQQWLNRFTPRVGDNISLYRGCAVASTTDGCENLISAGER